MPSLWKRVTQLILRLVETPYTQAVVLSAIITTSALLPAEGFGFKTCWLHAVLGVKCPGCGLTRSFIAMAHGRFLTAFQHHWVGPFLFAYFVLLWTDRVYRCTTLRPLFHFLEWKHTFSVFCWAIFAVWAVHITYLNNIAGS